VWNRAKNDGLLNTVSVARNLVSSPVPLGYSLCGVVLKVGYRCDHVQPGDRVVCGGFEYANHAEINAVARNMIVKVPDGVKDEEAAFSTVASVSLQALRLCDIKSGDTVLIMGMGLLGASLRRARGCAGRSGRGCRCRRREVRVSSRYSGLYPSRRGADG